MWQTWNWPYAELMQGDTLFWYQAQRQRQRKRVLWRTRVASVDRFEYASKQGAVSRLVSFHGELPPADYAYIEGCRESGYCLAWRVDKALRLDVPIPIGCRFPRKGWMRLGEAQALGWQLPPPEPQDVTLDDLAPSGALAERLRILDEKMRDVAPERVIAVVNVTRRNDTPLIRALKEACGYRCQFPGCGVRIPKRDGGYYIEVAHVTPVHAGGRSRLGNLLVLCPNHHKELEHGKLGISEQTRTWLKGTLNGVPFAIGLPDEAGGS